MSEYTRAYPIQEDRLGRWRAYEVGTLIECDFEKYDYKIDFGEVFIPEEQRTGFFENCETIKRQYYFHKDEIGLLL